MSLFARLIRTARKTLAGKVGYVVVDHSASPGLTSKDLIGAPKGTVAVGEGEVFERDVVQCSHCQRGVALNPGRVKARAYCPKCYAYICDACEVIRVAAGGACVPFMQVLDRAATLAEQHANQTDHPALLALEDVTKLQYQGPPTVYLS